MRINREGLDIIKRAESLRLEAYLCPAGVWTIGFGHTGDVKQGDRITAHQADAILDVDVSEAERIVTSGVTVPLNENQFSALVSFAFNVGPGKAGKKDGFLVLRNGKIPTIRRLVNAGDFGRYDPETKSYSGAAAEFGKWISGGGKILPGLVARRAAERELFLK